MSRNDSVNAPYTNTKRLGMHLGLEDDNTDFDVSTLDEFFDMAMGRPRVDWVPLPDAMPVMHGDERDEDAKFIGLHFGGGRKRLAGYHELDYPEWDAERMGEWRYPYPQDGMPVLSDTVDSVVVVHTLDHLTSAAVQHFLREAQRVLKPGGTISIAVPHHMGTLAHECIEHKTQYGLKTFRNILTEVNDASVDYPAGRQGWQLRVGYNMVLGLEERNLVQITQLIKIVNEPVHPDDTPVAW
jgi:SAM-dependent methyltransferase